VAVEFDAIVLGAGAAGLLCALTAGERGKRVLLLENSGKAGAKILISGGGRCNFTNMDVTAKSFISQNPHFAKSALSRFTPWDIMDMLAKGGASWHEKTLGQLFCDQGARKVLDILLQACSRVQVQLQMNAGVSSIKYQNGLYSVQAGSEKYEAPKLVMATGGISIPKMGATDFAYKVARQFGLSVVEPRPALVPLTFGAETVEAMKKLAGISVDCVASCNGTSFRENLLFTHRGLSGPAILQISSYWQSTMPIHLNLIPDISPDTSGTFVWLQQQKAERPKASLKTILTDVFADRLAEYFAVSHVGNLADMSNARLQLIANQLSDWTLTPTGTEGFKKAEVTKGGVCTSALSSKSMEVKQHPGLYFIGECVDVTGWLGGYNFQWAWASGAAAGHAL